MTQIKTYKAECKICKSPVYYYPVKLLIERVDYTENEPDDTETSMKVVSCTCTGEVSGTKHTLDFIFPNDFVKG